MNKILQGDALTKLKELPEKSVNMCMTSPPYWALRDYGDGNSQIWDEINGCKHEFEIYENKNPMDRGGYTQFNVSSGKLKEVSKNSVAFQGFCEKCKAWKGQLGLEPTFDLYIKHLCDIFDEVKKVLRDDGTCWVNIGDCYIGGHKGGSIHTKGSKYDNPDIIPQFKGTPKEKQEGMIEKCLVGIPFRFALEMINRGWILRNTIIWYKPSCMPSSVKDRFTVDFEYIFFFSKKKKYHFETQREPHLRPEREPRYASPKMKKYMEMGLMSKRDEIKNHPNGRNKRTVWTINPKPFKEAHFAVYPEELCETPIKAGCPEQGIVLDPFFGAGTTGLVALKQNKKFIGIELNKEYIEIAKKRLKPYLEQRKLKC